MNKLNSTEPEAPKYERIMVNFDRPHSIWDDLRARYLISEGHGGIRVLETDIRWILLAVSGPDGLRVVEYYWCFGQFFAERGKLYPWEVVKEAALKADIDDTMTALLDAYSIRDELRARREQIDIDRQQGLSAEGLVVHRLLEIIRWTEHELEQLVQSLNRTESSQFGWDEDYEEYEENEEYED